MAARLAPCPLRRTRWQRSPGAEVPRLPIPGLSPIIHASRASALSWRSMQVCSLVGLSKRVLAFDLDMVETIRKVEPVDLGSLRLGCSMGHKREARAARPQRVYDVVSVREQAHVLITIGRKPVGKPLDKPGGGHAASRARQRRERSSDDLTPRIRPPAAMPLSIGPEVPSECGYGLGYFAWRKGC